MKFTIEEIRKYLLSQDSRGDMLYNLSEENIKKANENDKVWQPEFDDEAQVKGHPEATVYSFQVWSTRENLLEDYPNCTPLEYDKNGIEEPTYMD